MEADDLGFDRPGLAELCRLSASDAVRKIGRGEITCEALVRSCLERIEQREAIVHAWAFLDPELVLKSARARDRMRPAGVLHGVPVGIKDIFDTASMPTEFNSPIYRGHRPRRDAECVVRANGAGAVVLGKTVTTEFAYRRAGPTTNPHDPAYTPGGSSSGSAAAVADFMVPLAIGSQTGGSTIRPASYCGIFGFRPTYGRIAFTGGKILSPSLDTVGLFARSVEDLCLFDSALMDAPAIDLEGGLESRLRIGYCETPFWSEAEEPSRRALAEAARKIRLAGNDVEDVELPESFRELAKAHSLLVAVESASAFAEEYRSYGDQLSVEMRSLIETGHGIDVGDVQNARALQLECATVVDRLFDRYAAILTPSAPGEAPQGLGSTGNPVFNGVWSAIHVPCISMPAATGPKALPVGVQLVGRRGRDRDLLRTAHRLIYSLRA